MKIEGTAAVVTGASGGIGLAVARALGERGARVVLAARSADKLKQVAGEIPGALAVPTDMTDADSIRDLFTKAREAFGRVDILVNNAGQGLMARIEAIDLDDYRAVIELNVVGALKAMQEAIPLMREQRGGTIINVSSMVSKNHFPGLAAYASTKYALNALTFTARQELEADSIVVSAFHPRMTATGFGANALGTPYDSHAGRPGLPVDSAEAVALAIIALIESGEPEGSM